MSAGRHEWLDPEDLPPVWPKLLAILGALALLWVIPADASGTGKKKPHKGTKVHAIEQRDPEPKKNCLAPVRVVGSQWPTASGAEESAQKAWSEAVRFNAGERYMELAHATQYQSRCSRSSIGEIAGQTLTRCEVEAIPCSPPFTAKAAP